MVFRKGYFPPPGAHAPAARETSVRSSNGVAKTIIQRLQMPRRLPGGAVAQEGRDVLQIRGPPVLSMGRLVEETERPTCFVYGQGWQGFMYGDRANQGKRSCLLAERTNPGRKLHSKFIPRYHPEGTGGPAGVRATGDVAQNTEEAIQELLVRSGAEVALNGGTGPPSTPEQALAVALANPECASRIEGILRSKLAELKAYCAHVECPDDDAHTL